MEASGRLKSIPLAEGEMNLQLLPGTKYNLVYVESGIDTTSPL